MKTKLLFLAVTLFFSVTVYSQVGINTTTPNPSSVLDVVSSTKGVLIPRMTTTERNSIASPVDGLHIYNTDSKCIDIYNSNIPNWTNLCPASSSFIPKILAFRTTDITGIANNVRVDIPFNDVVFNDLPSIGGGYNPTTGGFALAAGLYEISYGLIALPIDADFQDVPANSDVFIGSFENSVGNVAGSEIYGVAAKPLLGTTQAGVSNSSVTNTFYIRVATAQTYYLKGKFYNGTGGIISSNKVFSGAGSYNKPHLNNFISIKKLIQ